MSAPGIEQGPRQFSASVNVILQTDDREVTTDEIMAAVEQTLVLPATLDVGDGVTVLGGISVGTMEMMLAPPHEEGKYGR